MSEQSVTDFRNRARAWLAENAPRRSASEDEPGEQARSDTGGDNRHDHPENDDPAGEAPGDHGARIRPAQWY